ncbi:thioredoxin-like protein AAED1 [Aspergillus udagawae]|uniref:Thioredoxin-like protein AAED1 n=1 Tax=Aspergillus udagawae TaxID=91492 RepID=A0A8H3S634_9EURO|nr:thioredoxin-like protein AAED1 [Aspergillus udagawae]GFF99060.1 thioredoxin-like protein AAED1 [Aspergillus udagawae]GFG10703.1 thioredoxin-like protein AAED1 [Aspergillus udagawae]
MSDTIITRCDDIPGPKELSEAYELELQCPNGKPIRFGELVAGRGVQITTVVIFSVSLVHIALLAFSYTDNSQVRHFFCAYDQDYVRVVSRRLTDSVLSTLPNPTGPSQLIIVGCGDPQRIVPYVSETEVTFPIYTDPTGKIYEKLQMKRTKACMTSPPSYAQLSFFCALGQTFKQMFHSGWQAFRGGPWGQNGGEWVFRGGKCVFAHRMEHVSDHLTADQLLEVLSLDEPRNEVGIGRDMGVGVQFD